jgi:hypothetical protein
MKPQMFTSTITMHYNANFHIHHHNASQRKCNQIPLACCPCYFWNKLKRVTINAPVWSFLWQANKYGSFQLRRLAQNASLQRVHVHRVDRYRDLNLAFLAAADEIISPSWFMDTISTRAGIPNPKSVAS